MRIKIILNYILKGYLVLLCIISGLILLSALPTAIEKAIKMFIREGIYSSIKIFFTVVGGSIVWLHFPLIFGIPAAAFVCHRVDKIKKKIQELGIKSGIRYKIKSKKMIVFLDLLPKIFLMLLFYELDFRCTKLVSSICEKVKVEMNIVLFINRSIFILSHILFIFIPTYLFEKILLFISRRRKGKAMSV